MIVVAINSEHEWLARIVAGLACVGLVTVAGWLRLACRWAWSAAAFRLQEGK